MFYICFCFKGQECRVKRRVMCRSLWFSCAFYSPFLSSEYMHSLSRCLWCGASQGCSQRGSQSWLSSEGSTGGGFAGWPASLTTDSVRTTWASAEGSSPHRGCLLCEQQWESKRGSPRWKPWSLCDLILVVTSHHCCWVLFIRTESWGPAHTEGKGIAQGLGTKGGDHWGPPRVCLPLKAICISSFPTFG